MLLFEDFLEIFDLIDLIESLELFLDSASLFDLRDSLLDSLFDSLFDNNLDDFFDI